MNEVAPDELVEDFRRQCEEEGSAEACHSFAEYVHLARDNAAEALRLFRRNCDPPEAGARRFGPSCFAAGSLLAKESADASQEALGYFDKACAAGSGEGCTNAALIHRLGMYGTPRSEQRAYHYYDRACSAAGADGKGCFGAAVMLMKTDASESRVLDYFEKACLQGNPYGCSNGVVLLSKGQGDVQPDAERAARLRAMGTELANSMGLKIVKEGGQD